MLMNVEHFLLGFLSLCIALRPATITPVTSIARILSVRTCRARLLVLFHFALCSVYNNTRLTVSV